MTVPSLGAIEEARSEFPSIIEKLFLSGDLNRTDLIFAVDVFSASTNDSIYSYYHVGEGQEYALSAGRIDDQTISRIGSVSKLFTAYAIIAQAGIEVLSHPVTRYLPELAGNSTSDPLHKINWNTITVGALLSHQAGSGATPGICLSGQTTYHDPVSSLILQLSSITSAKIRIDRPQKV